MAETNCFVGDGGGDGGEPSVSRYEVDGLGNHLAMDDANVPSLLSAPYLGHVNMNGRPTLPRT
jgi:meiotically up-regulated gene 157 (Mug157) protein